ncbi:MAG: rod shape-determining protein [Spirochaetaceae bacterium]|nr:rod shape-determining protein [Myxococcales bacterium]MCB9725191.1 rod shape-determining protein [Spirochaetaceae bacterium]
MRMLGEDLAIDLGCSTTRVHVRGRDVTSSEPSLVAVLRVGREAGRVVAAGAEAAGLVGRTGDDIAVVPPIRGGAIADLECVDAMLRLRLPRASGLGRVRRPRIAVAVPRDLTNVERRAVEESVLRAGAREVVLVPKLLAAARGLELPQDRGPAHAILDLGAGTTEVGIVAGTHVVAARTTRVGASVLNDALRDFVRRKLNLLIGDPTAEAIKRRLGSARPSDSGESMEVCGRDLISGTPKTLRIGAEEVREALEGPVAAIVGLVRACLEDTPPELASDLRDRGLVMVGGGALLHGLDERLREETGLVVVCAEDPTRVVARGAAAFLAPGAARLGSGLTSLDAR